MEKSKTFEKEISLITDNKIKKYVEDTLEAAPDYFYTMAASSTGKYHPAYTLGEGGLVRHTKAAVKIANDLLQLELYQKLTPHRDEIIAALILHDCVKKGRDGSKFTTIDHPLDASKLLKESVSDPMDENVVNIASYIDSHMGQWNSDRFGNVILPKPKSLEQKFVHLCDYLASRKYLTVDLD